MNKPRKPKLPLWILRFMADESYDLSAVGDLEELYEDRVNYKGRFFASFWLWWHVLRSLPHFLIQSLCWRLGMFKNYLRITWRNIQRNKVFSLINVVGLAVGIACCIFILLYVQQELSYDTYHNDADRIYRIPLSAKGPVDGEVEPANTGILAGHLKKNFPQVEKAARVVLRDEAPIYVDNQLMYESDVDWADQEIFEIFNIPFIYGDKDNALSQPKTAVINEHMATKYFGNENPVGKTMRIDTTEFVVTGVVRNSPQNTHYKFNILGSLNTTDARGLFEHWHIAFITYVKLIPGIDEEQFEKQIEKISHEYLHSRTEYSSEMEFKSFLQPVKDIHLYSHLTWEMETPGSITYIIVFSLIGALILIIACFNFMNLSTARSVNRSCEVGIRKVVGANRSQLIKQFIGESILMSVLALAVALVILIIFFPLLNNLAGTEFSFENIFQGKMLFNVAGLLLLTGILGGFYPAFYMSAYKPVVVIKGMLTRGKKGASFRKILVIGQFAISIALIICTIVVFNQLNYMKNQDLGFSKEQKLVLIVPRGEYVKNNYLNLKSDLQSYHSVKGVTFSSSIPGRWMNKWRTWLAGKKETNSQFAYWMMVDQDYISQYGLKLIAGRKFNREIDLSDREISNINETAIKNFGWNSPEEAIGGKFGNLNVTVIGVIKDYHYAGLQNEIGPQILICRPIGYRCITLTAETGNLPETLTFVKNVYRDWFPDIPVEYFFLNDFFDSQYHTEERLGKIFSVFASLGIIVACLGLFGLASFMAQQRTKEVGVRKVLGASVVNIILLFSKGFTKWVLFANIIAWPAAWYAMNKWLQSYAYRIDIGIHIFLISGLAALIIALFAVSFQSIKSARGNPVEALKYE